MFAIVIVALATLLGVYAAGALTASADDGDGDTYRVTVTNITPGAGAASGQILNGLVVATHNADFTLFTLGAPASPGLDAVAEDADTSLLVPALMADPNVKDVKTNPADPILPGLSASVTVSNDKKHRFLSLATMLVTTNDAFAALNGVPLPKKPAVRSLRSLMTLVARPIPSSARTFPVHPAECRLCPCQQVLRDTFPSTQVSMALEA